jgi:cellulose synthase/poly-beta-1,6-N-acetylglucosamine synthase-like glycosyltransferase
LLVVKPAKAEIHMFFSALLYNSGLGYFVLIFMASYNKSRIDLNRNIFFNYQGINSVQFLGVILIMLIPCLILFLLLLWVNLTHSLLIINFICIVALINQKKIWKIIHNKLSQRKYTNLEGYRK